MEHKVIMKKANTDSDLSEIINVRLRLPEHIIAAIKALVINHMWLGVPQMELPGHIPTIVVGREMEDILNADPMNTEFMEYAVTAQNLEAGIRYAKKISGTDKIIVFDGSFGYVNLSPNLAEFLVKVAPEADREVEEELLPKWLQQRGIDPEKV